MNPNAGSASAHSPALQRGLVRRIGLRLCLALALSTASVAAVAPAASAEPAWQEVVTSRDGVGLASRRIPGSGLHELRASCVVDATPQRVFDVAMRRDSYENSTKHVTDYRVVARESEAVWFTYERLSFPLIRDRDYTLRYETTKTPARGEFRIGWTLANERGPAASQGVVRVTATHGMLHMRPDETGTKTLLTCTMFADPGGRIPHWLVNYVNRSTVPDLMRLLRTKSTSAAKTPTPKAAR